jgi:hypothetical protein
MIHHGAGKPVSSSAENPHTQSHLTVSRPVYPVELPTTWGTVPLPLHTVLKEVVTRVELPDPRRAGYGGPVSCRRTHPEATLPIHNSFRHADTAATAPGAPQEASNTTGGPRGQ